MPDNLTQRIQNELANRGVDTSLDKITKVLDDMPTMPNQNISQGKQPSIWESMEAGQAPEWLDTSEYKANLFTVLGKGMWAAAETAGMGIPGWALRGISPKAAEAVEPRTFAERVGAGIGGVGGFLVPFTGARAIAGAALKGATVVKGGKIVGMGTKAATTKYTDDVVRLLKNDEAFSGWAASKGMSQDDVVKFIKESGFVKTGDEAISAFGKKHGHSIFGNASVRTQYAKNLDDNIEAVLNSKIGEFRKMHGRDFQVAEETVKGMADELRKYVGGQYNFPITDLHSILSLQMGSTKAGSLIAAAAEEAILFTAVELPMNFFQSLNNEHVDLAPFATMGHAIALGSALGLVRLIPGGANMPIIGTAVKRMKQSLSKRRRWDKYNVNNSADRKLLTEHAKHLWDANKDIFATLTHMKGTNIGPLKQFVRDHQTIDEFALSATKAAELKKWMTNIEDNFLRNWWPAWGKQAAEDMSGSAMRMMAGSLAFNVGTVKAWMNNELPLEDLVFHTLLGAVLSKKGKAVEYKDANGDTQLVPGAEKPYYYSDSFEKANKYLDLLGWDLDHAAFRNILNQTEAFKKYGQPDIEHDDMVNLIGIMNKHKMVVSVDDAPDVKNDQVVSNTFYDTLKSILSASIKDDTTKRVKEFNELSTTEIQFLMKDLRNAKFKSLTEYKTKEGGYTGVQNHFDLWDIVSASSVPTTEKALGIYETALENAYEIMYELDHIANGGTGDAPLVQRKDGKLILRELSFEGTMTSEFDILRIADMFGTGDASDFNSALGIMRNRVIMKGQKMVFTPEMAEKLFGIRGENRGHVDRYDRELTAEFLGKDMPVDDNNLLTIGMENHMNMLKIHMLRRGIVKTYSELGKIRDKNPDSMFGEEVGEIHDMMNKIFIKDGVIPDSVIVRDAGGKAIAFDTREQRFATDLLQVLKGDINYNHHRKDVTGKETAKVGRGEISELIRRFEEKRLYEGFDRINNDRSEMVDAFVERLANYNFEKTLGVATRNDGMPLTEKDYAYLKVLQDFRLVGPRFDMAVLGDFVDNIRSMLLKSGLMTKAYEKAMDKDISTWVSKNLAIVDKAFDKLGTSKVRAERDLYEVFDGIRKTLVEQGGEQTTAAIMGDYLHMVNDILKPLWKTQQGGILKRSKHVQAKPTMDGISQLLLQMEAIKSGGLTVSYDQLIDSTYRLQVGSKDPIVKKFLSTVLNSVLDKQGNTNRALAILERYKIYSSKDGTWLIDSKHDTIATRLKKAAYDIQMLTQPMTTNRHISLMMERDKIEFTPRYDSDMNVNMSFDKLLTDWGINIEEIGNKKKSEIAMESISKNGRFHLYDFHEYLKGRVVTVEVNGKQFNPRNWDEMPMDDRVKFASDVVKVWKSMRLSRAINRLKLGEGALPLSEPGLTRRNNLTDLSDDLFGQTTFIDLEYRMANGRVYNVQRSGEEVLGKFVQDLANVGINKEGKLVMSDREVNPESREVEKSGNYLVTFGDLDYGIAIPMHPDTPGTSGQGAHALANRFVERLYSARERFKGRDDIIRTIDRLINRYIMDEGTRIVTDTKAPPLGVERKHVWRRPTKTKSGSDELSTMWAVVFGDTYFGDVFWNAAGNSKGSTKGWDPSKELAHDFLRRVRLFSNGSTLKLSQETAKEITEFFTNKDMWPAGDIVQVLGEGGVIETIPRIQNHEVLIDIMKDISNTGEVKAHLINDEADILPKMSSAVENLRTQVVEERKETEYNNKINVIGGEQGPRGERLFPEGAKDTSHFNSVVLVSERFMTALKLMTGDFYKTGSVANKPIIANASELDAAFIGKTMFVIDNNFKDYFTNNKVDMVIFGSAIKGMGNKWKDSLFDLQKDIGGDINNLLNFNSGGKGVVGIPIESIGIQMWHGEDKPARIPMHVGADLVGESLNGEYFDWLMRKTVDNYQNQVSTRINQSIDSMVSMGRSLFNDSGDDTDNQMYSTIGKMMEHNMYPMFLPWRRTMKNAMMRQFITKTGMFSPMNEFGSQSAAVPAYYPWGHEKGLRNTSFYTDDKGNTDIYTYGQMEVGIGNASKGIGGNVHIIRHRKGEADKILSWSDFVKDIKTKAANRIKFLQQKPVEKGKPTKAVLDEINHIRQFVTKANLESFAFKEGMNPRNTLQDLHFYLSKDLSKYNVFGEGETAEVAVVIHRTPSLKSSDKVIVGLKGFVEEGNLARINTTDFWTRLEGDHDFDKVNYWWDTPPGVLKEWNSLAHEIRAVVNDTKPTSISDLSIDNPASLTKYNFDSGRAQYMRGPVVKARRIVQWIKHYKGKETTVDGFSAIFGRPDSRFLIQTDPDRLKEIDKMIAKDAQRIIDSKDGFTEEDFDKNYLKNILFGNKQWKDSKGKRWKGIFVMNKRDTRMNRWHDRGELKQEWKDAVYEAIKPYSNFLQLSTDVYEGGEGKKVDYETLVSGYETYNDVVRGINRHVFRKLSKKTGEYAYDKSTLVEMMGDWSGFKSGNDVFGITETHFPSQASRTEMNTIGQTKHMLPFDRAVWGIASVDRTFVERPHKNFRHADEDFDAIWESTSGIDTEGRTGRVVERIVNDIRGNAKSMAYLNTLDRKISRLERSIFSAQRFRNEDMVETMKSRQAVLEGIKKEVEDRIILDKDAGAAIRSTIKSQTIEALLKGRPIRLPVWNKRANKWMPGLKEENLKGMSFSKRKQWVQQNMTRINYGIWNHPQKAVRIMGYNTNEYAQIIMWHKTMQDLAGFRPDPRVAEYSEAFEQDVVEFRRFIGKNWGQWKSNSGEYMPNEREDIVNALNMRKLQEKFEAWENTEEGMGLLFVFKMMTPQMDGTTVTYQQGHWMPGFKGGSKGIRKEQKFINLGLNFINKTDKIFNGDWLRLYAKREGVPYRTFAGGHDRKHEIFRVISENFTNKMRVLYGDVKVEESQVPASVEELLTGRQELKQDFSLGSLDESKQIRDDFEQDIDKLFATIEDGDLDKLDALNPELKLYYGITGTDITLDFMSMRGVPPGVDRLYEIRKLAEYYFRPYKVLNSNGRLRSIKDIKSFYGFVRKEPLIFYGKASEKNMLTGENTPHMDVHNWGERLDRGAEDAATVEQIFVDNIRSIRCG